MARAYYSTKELQFLMKIGDILDIFDRLRNVKHMIASMGKSSFKKDEDLHRSFKNKKQTRRHYFTLEQKNVKFDSFVGKSYFCTHGLFALTMSV